MRTCRPTSGPRSGRGRLPSGSSAAFTTTEVTAIDVSPSKAARGPLPPPPSASSPAVPIQIREELAAWDTWRMGRGRRVRRAPASCAASQEGDPMMRRRLLAVAALLLTLLAVVSVVGLVVEDPQDAFGVLLTLSLALVAAGYGLVRRGIVRVIALVLAGMLLLGVLEVLLDRRVLDRLTIVGLFWLAVAAAAAAFAVHVPLPRASDHNGRCLPEPPLGGRQGRAFQASRRGQQARDRTNRAWSGRRPGDAREDGGRRGSRRSGHGRRGRVAGRGRRGRGRARSPYACIPSGTLNHFALDLGVNREDVVGALDAFVDGGELSSILPR